MTKIKAHSYLEVSLFLIFFSVVDMASTEVILHHGKAIQAEANAIVNNLHNGYGIWLFRLGTLLIVALALYFSKLSSLEFRKLAEISSWDILFGETGGISGESKLKITVFSVVAVFSVSRLIAGLSNVSGEMAQLSIPILVDDLLPWLNHKFEYPAYVIISIAISIVASMIAWDINRKYYSALDEC